MIEILRETGNVERCKQTAESVTGKLRECVADKGSEETDTQIHLDAK